MTVKIGDLVVVLEELVTVKVGDPVVVLEGTSFVPVGHIGRLLRLDPECREGLPYCVSDRAPGGWGWWCAEVRLATPEEIASDQLSGGQADQL